MTQLTLTEPPAEPVTSTDAAMLYHWIEGGVSPSGLVPTLLMQLYGSRRPFDGPPDPHRRMWRESRINKALEELEAEGSIRYQQAVSSLGIWATDEGRRRYGRMNLETHLWNRWSKHAG